MAIQTTILRRCDRCEKAMGAALSSDDDSPVVFAVKGLGFTIELRDVCGKCEGRLKTLAAQIASGKREPKKKAGKPS